MTNSVFLHGKLEGKVRNQNLRKLVCQKMIPNGAEFEESTDTYYITHWTRDLNAHIMTIPNGRTVVITGRLEVNPTFGVVIVVEDHTLIK